MATKRILVLTDHMPWGHRSIAKAIYSFLADQKLGGAKVEYVEVKSELEVDLWKFIYNYLPASNKYFLKALDMPLVSKAFIKMAMTANSKNLIEAINKYKPDLVISTYFFHTHVLAKLRGKKIKNFEMWTVVADPWTPSTFSFSKEADLNIVYDNVAYKMGLEMGIKKSKLLKTGWWVRPEMYGKVDRQKAREKLGVTDDRPIVFVSGGSLGSVAIVKVLPTLVGIKKKITIVINTGTNELIKELAEQYDKVYRKVLKKHQVEIKTYGWIENMHEMLTASDIVLGKAGPNFLFDTIACKKPFVAITHMTGQEDGNIDLIKAKKLGWIREKESSLNNFLHDYVERPDYYHKVFKESIEKESEVNQRSMKLILERVKKVLVS